jgi:ribonuclease HI
MTNNQAEYLAVTLALEQCLKMGLTRVLVKSDSLLVVNQIKGSYKANNGPLRHLWEDTKKWCAQFQHVEFEHIPREDNGVADKLASDACKGGGVGTCYP